MELVQIENKSHLKTEIDNCTRAMSRVNILQGGSDMARFELARSHRD